MASYEFSPIDILDSTNAVGIGSGGSLTVGGGMSVDKDTFIGGNLAISGTTTSFADNIITLNVGDTSSVDTGLLMARNAQDITNNNNYSAFIYSENSNEFKFGYAVADTRGTLNLNSYVPIRTGGVNIQEGSLNALSDVNTIGNIFMTGGSIGIGTTSPTATLDVYGIMRATNSIITGSISATSDISTGTLETTNLISDNGTIGNLSVESIYVINDINTGKVESTNLTGVNGTISNLIVSNTFYIDQNTTTTIGNIYTNNQNVGIGNTAPVYPLDVSGNINFTGTLYKNGSIYSGSSVWDTNGTDVFYTGGNVGFGTTSPVTTVDISGNLNVSNSITVNTLNLTSATASNFLASTIYANTTNIDNIVGTIATLLNTNITNSTVDSLIGINTTLSNANITNSTMSSVVGTDFLLTNLTVTSLNLTNATANDLLASTINSSMSNLNNIIGTIATLLNATITNNTVESLIGTNMTLSNANITNVTSDTIFANTYSGGNLSLSGNLYVAGSTFTVNVTNSNLTYTTITASNANITDAVITDATIGTLVVDTLISSANINAMNTTTTNINAINITGSNAYIENGYINMFTSGIAVINNADITNLSSSNSQFMSVRITDSAYISNASIGSATTGDLIPAADITYNLGSSTNKWKDLYLSGNSIYLDNQRLTVTPDGYFSADKIDISSTIDASSSTSAALIISGGVGIQKSLNVENSIITNVLQSNTITSASAQITNTSMSNIYGTSATVSNVISDFIKSTSTTTDNLLTSKLNVSTGITTGNLNVNGILNLQNAVSNISIINENVTNSTINSLVGTNIYSNTISTNTISANTFSGSNLSLSGNLYVAGSTFTVNATNTNLTYTNITASNAQISNAYASIMTVGTLVADILVTSSNLSVLNGTIGNLVATSLSTSTIKLTGSTITNLSGTNVTVNNALITGGSLKATFNSNTIGSVFTTGGNVGINNTRPSFTLDVLGNINFTGSLTQNGGAFGGASQWTSISSNIVYTKGNIGIGTTNPGNTLHVSGGSRLAGMTYIGNAVPATLDNFALAVDGSAPNSAYRLGFVKKFGSGPTIAFGNASSFMIQCASAADISTVTSNTYATLMTITTNGNVGIGTTSPSYTLDVSGTGRVTNVVTTNVTGTNMTMGTMLLGSNISKVNYNSLNSSSSYGIPPAANGKINGVNITALNRKVYASNKTQNMSVNTWKSSSISMGSGTVTSIVWAAELGIFCMIANNGPSATSPDGINWSSGYNLPTGPYYNSIVWSPELGLFCASGDTSTYSNIVAISSDGKSWSSSSLPSSSQWSNAVWSSELGIFCILGNTVAATSPNGINWTQYTINNAWNNLVWAPELGLFVALRSGNNYCIRSSDGINWSYSSIPTTQQWSHMTWSPQLGLFVVVGEYTTTYLRSSDGINWTQSSLPYISKPTGISWSPELGLFCVTDSTSSSTTCIISPDGINWVSKTLAAGGQYRAITWSSELSIFCTVSVTGTTCISTMVIPSSMNTIKASVSQFTMNSSGYIGIGTSNPSTNLHVSGAILATINVSSAGLYSTNVTATNIVGTNISSTTLASSSATIGTLIGTNASISGAITTASAKVTNINATNITASSFIGTNVSTAVLIASSGITTGNINFTGNLYQNGSLYVSSQWTGTNGNTLYYGTSGSVNIGIGTTAPSYTLDVNGTGRITTSLTTGAVYTTNITSTNEVATNISSGTLNLSSGLTSASVQVTNANITTLTTSTAQMSNINATNITVSSLIGTNLNMTNLSSGTISATTYTGANLSLSGNLYVAGSVVTVNVTATNLIDTNITVSSAHIINANITTLTAATGQFTNIITTNVSGATLNLSTGLTSATAQVTNINATNISTAVLIASSGITTGNINFTGNLYQNGSLYVSSQWTGTNGNTLYYGTSGSVNVGIGTTAPSYTLDVNGTGRITTSLTTGAVYATNITSTNAVATNISSGILNLSTGLTSAAAQLTNANITTLTAATAQLTNVISTNVSSSTLNLSTGLTTTSAQVTNQNVTTSTIGTLNVNTLVTTSNLSGNIATISSAIITTNLLATGNSNTLGSLVTTGGNVGIGITAPSYMLTLSGTQNSIGAGPHIAAYISGNTYPIFQQLNYISDNISMNFDSYYDGSWRTSSTNPSYQISKSNARLNFNYANGGSAGSAVSWSTAMAISSSGNVGIGTAQVTPFTPSSPLVIRSGSSGGNTKLLCRTLNAGDSWWLGYCHNNDSSDSNDRARIGINILGGGTGRLFFSTGGPGSQVTAMWIGETGNIGIGNTSPNYTLDVTGTANITTSLTTGAVYATNITSTNEVSTNISSGTMNLSTGLTSASIQVTNENVTTSTIATARITTNLLALGNSNTIGNIFTTGGNVGIGTINPAAAALNFANSTGEKITLWGTSTAANYGFGIQGSLLQIHTDTSAADIAFGYGSSSSFTETMRIKGNGNVGIGTTSPSYNLDVSGTGRITTSLTTGAVYATNITSTNEVSTNISSGTMNLSTGLTSASIQVTNLNSTNITVGTLNVNTLVTTANLSGNNATIATARITSNLLALGNSNTLGSLVTTGGNVGIGTTGPRAVIDILGGSDNNGASGSPMIAFSYRNGGFRHFVKTRHNSFSNSGNCIDFYLNTSNTNEGSSAPGTGNLHIMSVCGDGVGIGTTSPGYTLDVAGTGRITTSLTTGAVYATNITSTNEVATNISSGTLNLSTGLTTASAQITNLNVTGNSTFGNVVTNNVNYGVSNVYSGSFAAANNIGTPTNVTGLSFSSSSTSSFTCKLTVSISATTSLYEYFNIDGIYTSTGWQLIYDSEGDVSGIVFSITSGGQIQYTSTNITGWTASVFRYTVTQTTSTGTYATLLNPTVGSYSIDSIQLNNTSVAVAGTNTGAFYSLGGVTVGKNLQVYSTTNSTALGSGGSLTVLGGGAVSKDMYIGGSLLATSNSNTIGSLVTTGGNVGIGIAVPYTPLDIYNTSAIQYPTCAQFLAPNATGGSSQLVTFNMGICSNTGGSFSSADYFTLGFFKYAVTSANNMFCIGHGSVSSTQFVVTRAGKVGIGSSSPSALLTLSGSESTVNGLGAGIQLNNNAAGSNNTWYIRAGATGTITPPGGLAFGDATAYRMVINSVGNVGIGLTAASYLLHLNSDSAAKPSTNTWTVSSDMRLKTNITMANLDVCYDNVKNIPLKRYTWKDEVYTVDQVADRSKLGWIAQDVEQIFPKAVEIKDMFGYSDCRSLNSDQLIATLYGAVQKLMNRVENLESIVNAT